MRLNRVKAIFINSSFSFLGYILQVVLGFVVRKVFIHALGVSYLGYNSVFTNILQVLNLADLGVGAAVTIFLYKPLAENDKERISSLMWLYKKIYYTIGIVVVCIGVLISIPLGIIIPDASIDIWYLRLLFYINLAGTASSFFLAYKRTLIIADQKSYIATYVDTTVLISISIIQIVCLLTAPNYIIFIVLNIVKNIISNIIISVKCRKLYDYLTLKNTNLIQEYKPQIIQYVKDVFISKVGAAIYYGTDNIILSLVEGSIVAGFLSNYTMITTYLTSVVTQMLSSIQATYGNYIHTEDSINNQKRTTDIYFCACFIFACTCMNCFDYIAQSFVSLYLGPAYIISNTTVVLLGINLMLTILIQIPSQIFAIYKMYRYDRPIIILSASLNIVISLVLARRIGMDGVLIGTLITSLIYLFSRFFIISQYVFEIPYYHYIKRILLYFVIAAITYFSINVTANLINGNTWLRFTIRAIFVVVISVIIPAMFLSFTDEYNLLIEKLWPNGIKRVLRTRLTAVLGVSLIGISIVIGKTFIDSNIDPTNKSLPRKISYSEEHIAAIPKVFHFSIDDTIVIFDDITTNNYESVFQNNSLAWLKKMHNEYGIVVTCYVYFESGDFALSECTGKYRNEFIQNSDWLRFGFHSLNSTTTYENKNVSLDYIKTVRELDRIVGSESIDNVIRLSGYNGSLQNIKNLIKLQSEPIMGLFTADDNRQSYYLNEEENKYAFCHDKYYDEDNGILFITTDLRLEYIDNVNDKIGELSSESWNNQLGIMEVFTHEWALGIDVKNKAEKLFKWAKDHKYEFVFPEDVTMR